MQIRPQISRGHLSSQAWHVQFGIPFEFPKPHHRGHAKNLDKNEISGAVVDAAMKIHSALGPGLLESAYAACLKHELISRGLRVAAEVPLPVVYDGVKLDVGTASIWWSKMWWL